MPKKKELRNGYRIEYVYSDDDFKLSYHVRTFYDYFNFIKFMHSILNDDHYSISNVYRV